MTNATVILDNRQTAVPIDLDRLDRRLRAAIAAERTASAELTVVIVDDATIRRWNREFLGHDWATDVISFPDEDACDAPQWDDIQPRGQGRAIAGELMVSAETARREADLRSASIDDELLLYCVHGWLHLCGYDDLTDEERPQMRARERAVLAPLGLIPTDLETE